MHKNSYSVLCTMPQDRPFHNLQADGYDLTLTKVVFYNKRWLVLKKTASVFNRRHVVTITHNGKVENSERKE